MQARVRKLLGETLWRRLALFALDAAGALLGLRAWAGRWLAAVFTVWWDPLRRSRALIRLRGRGRYAGFRVVAAPSEFERRAVAWFYRWHETPDDADWQACLARFGLGAPPGHTLQFEDAGGVPDPTAVQVAAIVLAAPPARGSRRLQRAPSAPGGRGPAEVAGPTPIGGLAPQSFVRDLDRAAGAPLSGRA